MHLGNNLSLQQQITSVDAKGTWIYPDQQQPAVDSWLTTLAKLYVAGVRFNSKNLFPQNLRRVVLPTYPFQEKTYRVEVITTQVEQETISTTTSALLPMEKLPSLLPQQRHSSHAKLTEDLVSFDNNHQPNNTKLLPIEKPTLLSAEQRQQSYLLLKKGLG